MNLKHTLLFLIGLSALSSCLTSKGTFKSGPQAEKKGEIVDMENVGYEPDVRSLMLSAGLKRRPGLGPEGTYMFNNTSRIDASLFFYVDKFFPFWQEYSEQRNVGGLYEKHYMHAVYSYPFQKRISDKRGEMYLRRTEVNSDDGAHAYLLRSNFNVLRVFNAVGGIEHNFVSYSTEEYTNYLENKNPDADFFFNSSTTPVFQGTYYMKLGVSQDQYVNTHLIAKIKGDQYEGSLTRELHFGVNALIGLFGHMPTTLVEYEVQENFISEERVDEVDLREHLEYNRLGFEFNFRWMNYTSMIAQKYGFSIGLMPGYRDPGRWATGLLIKLDYAMGIGRILN